MSLKRKKKLLKNIDSLVPDFSSIVDSGQQESITKTEGNQKQPVNDTHLQFNRSRKFGKDLSDQENQEHDPNISNGEEDGRKDQGEVGTHINHQENEREFHKEHSNREKTVLNMMIFWNSATNQLK